MEIEVNDIVKTKESKRGFDMLAKVIKIYEDSSLTPMVKLREKSNNWIIYQKKEKIELIAKNIDNL